MKTEVSKPKLKLLERDVEKYLVKRIKEIGGEIRKIKWIGRKDAPDRMVAFNGAWFVELKRPGEKPRASQTREHERLKQQGLRVCTLSCITSIDEFINEICSP